MAVVGAMSGILTLETSQWKKGAKEARAEANGIRDTIKDLKSTFGKGSLSGQLFKLAAGGGALAGLSMALGEVGAFTGKIAEMANGFRSGSVSAGKFAEEVAGSLPVLGRAWQIGRNIREAFTGEEAAIKKANDAMKMQVRFLNEAYNVTQKMLADKRSAIDQLKDEFESAKNAMHMSVYGGDEESNAEIETQLKITELQKSARKAEHEDTIKALQDRLKLFAKQPKLSAYDQARKQATETELHAALKIREDIEKQLAVTIQEVQLASEAKINDIRQKNAQELAKTQAELAKQEAAKVKASHRKDLESKLEALGEQKKLIKDQEIDAGYRSVSSSARQYSGIVQNAPNVANKMETLSRQQVEKLGSIEIEMKGIRHELKGTDEITIDFG